MPVIDGEKWACSSCIKGHRVSGCNHNDRELHHINPKGRPVKQCEHCRGARKSKSHHAKCDCGDKKDKEKSKDKGDLKSVTMAGNDGHDNTNTLLALEGRCQCHFGTKCVCGTGNDFYDPKVDTSRLSLHDARAKPKLVTTHSEPQLTVFANGHHKPCHRNNNSAHISGAPYRIPRPHTLHGHSAFAALAQSGSGYGSSDVPATRSMDTLSVSNHDFYAMFGSAPRSMDSLPTTDINSNLNAIAYQDSLFPGSTTMFGSEAPSTNSSDNFSGQQWPWSATTTTSANNTFAYSNFSASPSQEHLTNLENDWSIPSAGFNPLWSAGDLPLDPSKFSDSLTQPTSHSGDSKQSGPGLTTASSAHSEVGEANNLFGELDFKTPQSSASETLFWEDSPIYSLNTSAPSDNLATSGAMPAMTTIANMQVLQPTFSKAITSLPTSTACAVQVSHAETPAIVVPGNFEDMITVDPWTMDQSNASYGGMAGFEVPNNWF